MSQKSSRPSIFAVREALAQLQADTADPTLSDGYRRSIDRQLRPLVAEFGDLLARLDPISGPVSVFDPSEPKVVGRFVSLALVAQARHPLSQIPRTYGSGVYAIYYNGDFPPYAPLRGTETPIYVGQAAPLTRNAKTPKEQGPRLCSRLSDHRKNIAKASSTLSLADFEFRSLVVQTGWETAAEDYLIHLFHPIWNSETNILYGLGKHGDAAETRANKRSPWDTFHPGRSWAAASSDNATTPEEIERKLRLHFARNPPFQDLDQLLASFVDELRQI